MVVPASDPGQTPPGKSADGTLRRVLTAPMRRWAARRARQQAVVAARQYERDRLDEELAALHEALWRDWPDLVARTREQVREEHRGGTPE